MQATTNVSVKNSISKPKRKHSRGSKANFDVIKLPEELVELIKEDDNKSSYIGGVIAVLVIIFLLGLIAIATYLTMPPPKNNDHQTPISFSDIFKIQKDFLMEFQWKEGALLYRNSSGDLYKITVSNHNQINTILFLQNGFFRQDMEISNDLTAWFYPNDFSKSHDGPKIFTYELVHIINGSHKSQTLQINETNDNYFNSVAWGPTSKSMIIAFQKNIYYSNNPFIQNSFTCLSCPLNQNRLYGHFVGYYADRIFKTNKAYWWDKDGKYLAFLSLVEEPDKLVPVEIFQFKSLYSEFRNLSYSKAGLSPAPYNCEIYVIEIRSQRIFSFNLTKSAPFSLFYVVHVQWFGSSALIISLLSHQQNGAAILFCPLSNVECFVVVDQIFGSGWIDMEEYQNILPLEDQHSLAIAITTSDTFYARRHLAIVSINNQSKNIIKWLSMGNRYVSQLTAYEPFSKDVYYLSWDINATTSLVYSTNIESMRSECISCQIVSCNRSSAYFSSNVSVFLHECSDMKPKSYHIIYLNSNNFNHSISIKLDWNKDFYEYLLNKSMPRIEYIPIKLSENHRNYFILTKIYHPKHLNPEHAIKYPVLLILPDDPYQTNIRDDVNIGWIEYLTSFLQYVVIRMEVRGAKSHYYNYHAGLKYKLGFSDFNDIINGLKSVFSQRKYLDNSSIGVIGQTYGGYLAVKLLYNHDNFPNFRCGAAVNPVVDFSIYDSFFAERYFQIYKEKNKYYQNAKLKFISKSPTKEFILIHEMNKFDVLFDNSVKLIKDLIDNNIQFDYVPFYGNTHEKVPWNRNGFLLKKLISFYANCFNKTSLQYSLLANKDFHSF